MLAVSGVFVHKRTETPAPPGTPLARFPAELPGWHTASRATFDERSLAVLKPSDYLSRLYRAHDGRIVELYIGRHSGREGKGIHSPKHCLPGSGWHEVSSRIARLEVNGAKIAAVQSLYQMDGQSMLLLYWFQVGRRTLTSEYALKIYEVVEEFRRGYREAVFVRMATPVHGSTETAAAAQYEFLRAAYPSLQELIAM